MEIPPELRRSPPRPTLEWVAAQIGPGAQVTAVRRLRNAWAAAMHAVDVDDEQGRRHELVLRRWARHDLPPDPGVVANEAAALRLLMAANTGAEPRTPELRTPEFIAADAEGALADVPALLMTRLPGHDVLAPPDLDAYLDGLVGALHAIHAVPVAPEVELERYRPWGVENLTEPPPWTRHRSAWTHAISTAHGPIPSYTTVFCHRDYHPGNVLWHDGRVSGVVDWTHACRGPAAADVAHCRANLTLLFGLDVADDFARRYGAVDDLALFDLLTQVGFGDLSTWRWHDAGRLDIDEAALIRAGDALLVSAVERLG
jgi:aminoglycoside phosphotransferase (APT) family kinase protein